MSDDAVPAILAYVVGEWQRLQPMGDAQPPRGVWMCTHEPVPVDTVDRIETPIRNAWYGNTIGVHERDVDSVVRLRANVDAWNGRPYFRWGWAHFARLESEPVYYLECLWGPLDGYGVQAAVTDRGLVLTSSYLWRS
jgi:hypothetical protein